MPNRKPFRKTAIALFVFSILISALLVPYVPINRFRFMGAVLTFIGASYILYLYEDRLRIKLLPVFDKFHSPHGLVYSKTILALVFFIIVNVAWCGLDIFMNPHLFEYNHGNGAYFAQVLHNICKGIGPENTVKYNEVIFYHSNPYYYASAFAAVPHLLACSLLPLLYSFFPFPPMHVFAVVSLVLVFGPLGVYTAVRALNGPKVLSLLAAVGYCLMPWVERPIFMHGHFDVISFAVYPYVFAFLFSRRWMLFYVSVFLLAIINIPYTYSVVAIGLITVVFFRARLPGLVVIAIGLLVMFWDQAIVRESLKGIWDTTERPSGTLIQILMDLDSASLAKAALYHLVFLFLLLMTVGFIPVRGIRKDNRWNWPVVGMLLFAVVGAAMGLLRSYDLASHRNANMVVPVYLSAFMVITGFYQTSSDTSTKIKDDNSTNVLATLFLFIGIASMTLWFSNHYPWAGVTNKGILSLNYFTSASVNDKYRHVLGKMKEFVPEDASVAYRIDAAIQAYITNRQKAWYLGYHPDGVEYYFIQTKDIVYIDKNLPPWREYLDKVEQDKNNIVLYKDDGLVIYKNLNPKPIPRLESVLGWNILLKALIPNRYSVSH